AAVPVSEGTRTPDRLEPVPSVPALTDGQPARLLVVSRVLEELVSSFASHGHDLRDCRRLVVLEYLDQLRKGGNGLFSAVELEEEGSLARECPSELLAS